MTIGEIGEVELWVRGVLCATRPNKVLWRVLTDEWLALGPSVFGMVDSFFTSHTWHSFTLRN